MQEEKQKVIQIETQDEWQGNPTVFTKEQILASTKYQSRRDMLSALLEDNQDYTTETIEKLIENFMKGQVK